ncbi:DUF488 domain-containing protein [Bartonella senegalensis]|uniref:DUF488 domain-containing protein n=1 Tax=Bartonella senegalensis TaxID=1468418 RepID=UPI001FCB39D6|nr:DUF488 domain-containing protein [Bartonella senegalensis]
MGDFSSQHPHPFHTRKSNICNTKHAFILSDKDEKPCFFTIGYEGKSLENYLYLYCLIKNNIKILCDVRKNSISRQHGFLKRQLENAVNNIGIEYVHMPEFGIASEKRRNLKTREDYEHLFEDYQKTTLKNNPHAIEKLYQLFWIKGVLQLLALKLMCVCVIEDKLQRLLHNSKIGNMKLNTSNK